MRCVLLTSRWRREWVVPSVLMRYTDGSDETHDPNALRILKWVRTPEVETFVDTNEDADAGAPQAQP